MQISVTTIENRFFGEKITVSGLITGQDLKEQLRVLLAKGSCKNITKEEVHELVDEIYADYEQR